MYEPNKWLILVLASMGLFVCTTQITAVLVSLPSTLEALNASVISVMWVLLSFILTLTSTVIIMGRIGDLVGKAVLFNLGWAILILGSLLSTFAVSKKHKGWDLVGYRAVCGLASALLMANSNSLVTDAFPKKQLGLAMGITTFCLALGIAFGPVYGGALTEISFKWVHFVNAPFAAIALVVGIIWLQDPSATRERLPRTWKEVGKRMQALDWGGVLLSTLFLVCFLLSLSELAFPSLTKISRICIWVLVGMSFVALLITEYCREDGALLKLRLWLSRAFWISNVTNALSYLSANVVLLAVIFYFHGPGGKKPFTTGLLMLPDGIAFMISSLAAGVLTDRIGVKFMSVSGLILSAGGVLGLAQLTPKTSIPLIEIYLFMIGFGQGMFTAPMAHAVMNSVEPHDRGSAYATNALLSSLFRMASIVIVFAASFQKLSQSALLSIFFHGGGAIAQNDIQVFMDGVRICAWVSTATFCAAIIITMLFKEDFWETWEKFKLRRKAVGLEE
jgi:MFS family permease